jgi:hypothetical protein
MATVTSNNVPSMVVAVYMERPAITHILTAIPMKIVPVATLGAAGDLGAEVCAGGKYRRSIVAGGRCLCFSCGFGLCYGTSKSNTQKAEEVDELHGDSDIEEYDVNCSRTFKAVSEAFEVHRWQRAEDLIPFFSRHFSYCYPD